MSSFPVDDVLLEFDPEPCDTCKTGVSKMVCFDDKRRCPKCITRLIKKNRVVGKPPPPPPKKKRWKKGTPHEDQQGLF